MIVVYTTIFGSSDSLKPAPRGADRCVCFTDDLALCEGETRGWTIQVGKRPENPRREAWHLRCIPHQLFPDATHSIWIDASFTLTHLPLLLKDAEGHAIAGLRHHRRSSCYEEGREIIDVGQASHADVMRQLDGYRAARFAPRYLTISCLLVREHGSAVAAFNDRWDAEIQMYAGDNTQISLDYAAWKTGLAIHGLRGTRHKNPYATHDHEDHKKRRKPYDTEAAA